MSGESFDLVLSDLRMPDVNGRQLHDVLCTTDPRLASRLIFVTGDSLDDAAGRLLAQTGRPVIEKPFTPEEIRTVVARELAQA